MAEVHPIPSSPRFQNLTGKIFGRLTVETYAGRHQSGTLWLCGCLKKEHPNRLTHGGRNSYEYGIWCGMISRCGRKTYLRYADYGGRGISVCPRWKGLQGFENFLKDMGNRPTKDHSIERRNNDGNYEPSNCIWATRDDQGKNKRNNVVPTFRGVTKIVAEWSRETGIKEGTICYRIRKGWSAEDILTIPVGQRTGNARMLTFNGITDSICGWERRTGINEGTIHARLKLGWAIEESLTIPIRVFRFSSESRESGSGIPETESAQS
jgi:hypothetical protein